MSTVGFLAAGVPAALVGAMQDACDHFRINTPARLGAFLGQCWVETQAFAVMTEDLSYSDAARIAAIFPREVPSVAAARSLVRNPQALALAVYSGRLGNGGSATGDGFKFIGRGCADLTGRALYAAAGAALGRPYVDQPELVAQPLDAALTAAWFFSSRNCAGAADRQDWDGVTRLWNGPAMLDAAQRALRSAIAMRAFA